MKSSNKCRSCNQLAREEYEFQCEFQSCACTGTRHILQNTPVAATLLLQQLFCCKQLFCCSNSSVAATLLLQQLFCCSKAKSGEETYHECFRPILNGSASCFSYGSFLRDAVTSIKSNINMQGLQEWTVFERGRYVNKSNIIMHGLSAHERILQQHLNALFIIRIYLSI
jgi:hypothetical protein